MYFEQFYLTCLAHASYMIASEGVAVVVDPQRDVDIYLDEAARNGFEIAYVVETHLHADFVSGHRELVVRAPGRGSKIYVSSRAGAQFPHVPVKDGDELRFGRCVLRFIETPGHTPESICLLVTDLDRSPEPWAVLTGDTLFIGDVGRPDLSPEFTPQQLAALLYRSLHQKLLSLPDQVEVYPAHGAGSLCGRNISPERRSTIGKERAFNYALRPMSEDEFVRLLTSDLPERPDYFARDAEINRSGASALGELPPLPAFSPHQVARHQSEGALVLDTRPAAQFGAGHVPGAINIGLSGQYASWAARLLGLDQPLILVVEDPGRLQESRMRLARVGMEKVIGYLEGGVLAWEKAGLPLRQTPQISVLELNEQLCDVPSELQLLDVRNPGEWQAGHIEQAAHIPLDQLRSAVSAGASLQTGPLARVALDPSKALAVHCKSGYRSSIAASLLERAGFFQVMNVVGGFDAWQTQKLPAVTRPPACAASVEPASKVSGQSR